MHRWQKIALLSAAFSLVSCGGHKPVTPNQRKLANGGGQPVVDPNRGCAAAPGNFHQVTLHFNRALPAHLGLRLDTDPTVRVSECADLTQAGPLVQMVRLTANDLMVHVDHRSFYATLPRDAGFELYDLHTCGADMDSFYKVLPSVPLTWHLENPNGATCAGRAVGDYKGNAADFVGYE